MSIDPLTAAITVATTLARTAADTAAARARARAATAAAAHSREEAANEAETLRRSTRRVLGRQRALYGRAGVAQAGSPLAVQAETAAEGELDAREILRAGDARAARLLNEAYLARLRGREALATGVLGAGRTILTAPPRRPSPWPVLDPPPHPFPLPSPGTPPIILL